MMKLMGSFKNSDLLPTLEFFLANNENSLKISIMVLQDKSNDNSTKKETR